MSNAERPVLGLTPQLARWRVLTMSSWARSGPTGTTQPSTGHDQKAFAGSNSGLNLLVAAPEVFEKFRAGTSQIMVSVLLAWRNGTNLNR
jgi:hypothetical protein